MVPNANQIHQVFAYVIENKRDCRMVVEFKDQPLNETMLVDFSNEGEPFTDGTICFWSVSRDIMKDNEYCGTEEIDSGRFDNYTDILCFLLENLQKHDCEIKAESF